MGLSGHVICLLAVIVASAYGRTLFNHRLNSLNSITPTWNFTYQYTSHLGGSIHKNFSISLEHSNKALPTFKFNSTNQEFFFHHPTFNFHHKNDGIPAYKLDFLPSFGHGMQDKSFIRTYANHFYNFSFETLKNGDISWNFTYAYLDKNGGPAYNFTISRLGCYCGGGGDYTKWNFTYSHATTSKEVYNFTTSSDDWIVKYKREKFNLLGEHHEKVSKIPAINMDYHHGKEVVVKNSGSELQFYSVSLKQDGKVGMTPALRFAYVDDEKVEDVNVNNGRFGCICGQGGGGDYPNYGGDGCNPVDG